jgi:hypothetical protein
MAFLERHLNRFAAVYSGAGVALVVLAIFTCAVSAQPEAPPATFRTLAFGADVSEVFYDLHGKSVPIAAAAAGLSMPYEIPAGGRVVF